MKRKKSPLNPAAQLIKRERESLEREARRNAGGAPSGVGAPEVAGEEATDHSRSSETLEPSPVETDEGIDPTVATGDGLGTAASPRVAASGRRNPSVSGADRGGTERGASGRATADRGRSSHRHSAPTLENAVEPTAEIPLPLLVGGGIILAASFAWAYAPTLQALYHAWDEQPDYSHGFLVAPLAVFFLWARSGTFPGFTRRLGWVVGIGLLGLSMVLRYLGSLWYIDALDGWSILIWCSGVAWLLGRWPLFKWASPAIAFLFFMVPMPYRAEGMLSRPLQGTATQITSWLLQCLGQPALAEGNTIWLGEHQLEVAEACSGLRIFVSIVALAFAYLVLVRRAWWERIILVASVLPVALLANSLRITFTGLLYQYVSGDAAQKFSHDFAGWMMIPVAAGMFAFVGYYLQKLSPEVAVADVRHMVRTHRH